MTKSTRGAIAGMSYAGAATGRWAAAAKVNRSFLSCECASNPARNSCNNVTKFCRSHLRLPQTGNSQSRSNPSKPHDSRRAMADSMKVFRRDFLSAMLDTFLPPPQTRRTFKWGYFKRSLVTRRNPSGAPGSGRIAPVMGQTKAQPRIK